MHNSMLRIRMAELHFKQQLKVDISTLWRDCFKRRLMSTLLLLNGMAELHFKQQLEVDISILWRGCMLQGRSSH